MPCEFTTFFAPCLATVSAALLMACSTDQEARPPAGQFRAHVLELRQLEARYGAWTPYAGYDAPVKRILTRLAAAAQIPVPTLSLLSTREPHAFLTSHQQIVLSRGLLEQLPTADQIAFVIAHELGHAALKHPRSGHDNPDNEAEADHFAYDLTNRAGYDPFEGCFALITLLTSPERLRLLGCPSTKAHGTTVVPLEFKDSQI